MNLSATIDTAYKYAERARTRLSPAKRCPPGVTKVRADQAFTYLSLALAHLRSASEAVRPVKR